MMKRRVGRMLDDLAMVVPALLFFAFIFATGYAHLT